MTDRLYYQDDDGQYIELVEKQSCGAISTINICLKEGTKQTRTLRLMIQSDGIVHQVVCADDSTDGHPVDDCGAAWPDVSTTINVTQGTDSEIIARFFNN